jgi:AcrR family transcriptional regulator
MTQARRPGGRNARVRAQILAATVDLVARAGVAGFTYDEVAERAGVHKTSVYRNWPNRDDLVIEALSRHADQQVPFADTGDLRADLVEFLLALAAELETSIGRALVNALQSTSARWSAGPSGACSTSAWRWSVPDSTERPSAANYRRSTRSSSPNWSPARYTSIAAEATPLSAAPRRNTSPTSYWQASESPRTRDPGGGCPSSDEREMGSPALTVSQRTQTGFTSRSANAANTPRCWRRGP